MRAFLTACLVVIVAAVVGLFILDTMQQSSMVAYTTVGARI